MTGVGKVPGETEKLKGATSERGRWQPYIYEQHLPGTVTETFKREMRRYLPKKHLKGSEGWEQKTG